MSKGFCQFCGEKLDKNDIFCKECGAKIDNDDEVKDAIIESNKAKKKDTQFLLSLIAILLVVICVVTFFIILFK